MGRRSRSRSASLQSRSRSVSPDSYRVHVGELNMQTTEKDLEKTFGKFGEIGEVWMAHSPPCFAFIVFKKRNDAADAIEAMHGKMFCGSKINVSWAKPRTRGRRPPPSRMFNNDLTCYQCGQRGHFSRDCEDVHRNRRRARSRTPSYSPFPRKRSITRSRSRSKQRRSDMGRHRGSPAQYKQRRSPIGSSNRNRRPRSRSYGSGRS